MPKIMWQEEVAQRRPNKWHSKRCPKIKQACAQEAPRRSPPYSKGRS